MSGSGGKGDKRRPGKGYGDGFDRIFGESSLRSTKPEENKDKDGIFVVIHHEEWLGPICSEDRKRPRRETED